MLNKEALRDAMYYICANLYKGFNIKAPHEQESIVDYWCIVFEDKYIDRLNKDNECTFKELCEAFKQHNKAGTVDRSGKVASFYAPMKAVVVIKVKNNAGEPVDLPEEQRSFLINSFDPYFADNSDYISGNAINPAYFGIYTQCLYPDKWNLERIYFVKD